MIGEDGSQLGVMSSKDAMKIDVYKRQGEYAAANNLHGALVYGIGNSTEAVYYLDTGIVGCLVAVSYTHLDVYKRQV